MSSLDSSKREFNFWQILSVGLSGKKQEGLAFDLERENVVGIARSIWGGEMPLNDLHRAVVRVCEILRGSGAESLTCRDGEYKGRTGPIDVIDWSMAAPDERCCGLFVALPWFDGLDTLTAVRLSLNFAIGALALAPGGDWRDVTIAWVSRGQDIRADGNLTDHLIRTYSRDDLRTKDRWTGFVDLLTLGSKLLGGALTAVEPTPIAKRPERRDDRDSEPSTPPVFRSSDRGDADVLMSAIAQIAAELTAVRRGLEAIAQALEGNKPLDPFVYPLSRFKGFDFGAIGIEVDESDSQGPTHVVYHGRIYTRRSPVNKKFAPVIFYSRAIGKDDEDNNNYECLIKFKTFSEAESLDPRAAQLTGVGQ